MGLGAVGAVSGYKRSLKRLRRQAMGPWFSPQLRLGRKQTKSEKLKAKAVEMRPWAQVQLRNLTKHKSQKNKQTSQHPPPIKPPNLSLSHETIITVFLSSVSFLPNLPHCHPCSFKFMVLSINCCYIHVYICIYVCMSVYICA